MAKIIGYGRSNRNAGNKALAKMFRKQMVKPIIPIDARQKPTHRARRSDYGKKRA